MVTFPSVRHQCHVTDRYQIILLSDRGICMNNVPNQQHGQDSNPWPPSHKCNVLPTYIHHQATQYNEDTRRQASQLPVRIRCSTTTSATTKSTTPTTIAAATATTTPVSASTTTESTSHACQHSHSLINHFHDHRLTKIPDQLLKVWFISICVSIYVQISLDLPNGSYIKKSVHKQTIRSTAGGSWITDHPYTVNTTYVTACELEMMGYIPKCGTLFLCCWHHPVNMTEWSDNDKILNLDKQEIPK